MGLFLHEEPVLKTLEDMVWLLRFFLGLNGSIGLRIFLSRLQFPVWSLIACENSASKEGTLR